MTVSVDGGEPTSLNVNREFLLHFRPLWSPDGDAIIFYGVRKREPDKPDGWWLAPLTGGEPRPVRLPGEEQGFPGESVCAWIRGKDGAEWIIYSVAKGEVWQLFRFVFPPRPAFRETGTAHFRNRPPRLRPFSFGGRQASLRNPHVHKFDLRDPD